MNCVPAKNAYPFDSTSVETIKLEMCHISFSLSWPSNRLEPNRLLHKVIFTPPSWNILHEVHHEDPS